MKFSKEFLQDVIDSSAVVESNITGTGRWSIHYRAIFEHEGRFYETNYRVAATEVQDERPYEYAPDEIECPEVHKVQKLVDVWEAVAVGRESDGVEAQAK